jgi:hypothetical protein
LVNYVSCVSPAEVVAAKSDHGHKAQGNG